MFESFSESVKYFATSAGALLMVSAVLLGIVFAAAQMGPATRVSEADILGGKRSIQVLQDGSDWLSEAYWERKRAQSLGQLQRPPYRSSKQRSLPLSNRADPKPYRTVCVRLCDGYYFPISFSTTRDRFVDDAQACKARCSSEARLFYHPSDAQDVSQLIDRDGNAYGELANAFLYRTRYDPLCQCRPPPWSEEARQRHAIYATEAWQEKAKKLAEAQVREKAPTNSSTTDTGPSKVNAAAVSGETDATSDTTAYKNMRMGLGRLSGAPPAQAPRVSDSSNRSWRDRVFNTLTD